MSGRSGLIRRGFAVVLALVVLGITPAGTVAEETDGVTAQSSHTLTTVASPDTTLGGTLADTATLAGAVNPTGTITFSLFLDLTCAVPIFTSTVPVAGNGNYTSASFTPTSPGTYQWVASYSGDVNNTPIGTACNDPNESVVVSLATPELTTIASPDVTLGDGGGLTDTATLAGGFNPTGVIGFTLFGPNDSTCSVVAHGESVPVAGNGTYTSQVSFFPLVPGEYQWVASYSGDANNEFTVTACNDANELTVVNPFPTTLTTVASPDVVIGGALSDTATLTGSAVLPPIGSITFSLFGPDNATCTGTPVFTSTVPVSGNGNYTSNPPFAPTESGTYRWIANYSGDSINAPASTACIDPNEDAVVSQTPTTVTTMASPDIMLGGGTLSDTATLADGFNPTGTVTFSLFGPNDATCAGPPIFNSIEPVSGNGSYVSAQFTPVNVGTYRWIASYSGDANNLPASGACNDANESAVVAPAGVTIITDASPGIELGGGTLSDSATVVGRVNPLPGASIDFRLYGPGDALCAGPPIFESLNVPYPATEGPVTSTAFTPTQPGTYRWIASYSGDANNAPITGACNAPNETVVVTEAAGVPAGSPGSTQAGSLVTTAAPVRSAQLPRTGIEPQRQVVLALLLLIGGALLLLTSRTHLATYTPRHKNGRYTPRHH